MTAEEGLVGAGRRALRYLVASRGVLQCSTSREGRQVDSFTLSSQQARQLNLLLIHVFCREKLFDLINELPTCFEVVSGKAKMEKKPLPLKRSLPPSSRTLGPTSKSYRPVSPSVLTTFRYITPGWESVSVCG